MKDLTRGSITGHLIAMAVPMAATMVIQTLYFFVDLYFVAQLGQAAIAGVSAAGNAMFVITALTQVLGVGTVTLIAHAVGRKDRDDANGVFHQALLIAAVCGLLTLLAVYPLAPLYVRIIAADEDTVREGTRYLYWFGPGLALQFAMVAMSSALRGTGIVRPTMVVQTATLLINTALAPVLIAGLGSGYALGVRGAGLASSIAVAAGVVMLLIYFMRLEKFVSFDGAQWQPRFAIWRRMLTIGLPAGGEFLLMFFSTAVTYWVIRDFGAAAQAGYGIGTRVMQGIFLPALAVAFAVAPVAGQNFGARQPGRVRETFSRASVLITVLMCLLMLLCQWRAAALIALFSSEPDVIEVGATFLRIIAWTFPVSGMVFTCSGVFQALGNTVPALLGSALRLVVYCAAVFWLASQPGLQLAYVWYAVVMAMVLHVLVSLALLKGQLRTRLAALEPASQA